MVSLHFIFPGNQSARFVWFFFSIFAFERQSSFASVAPWIPRWKHVLKIPTENKSKIAHIALLPTKEKGNNKKLCVWKKEGNDDGSRKEEGGEEKRRKRLKKKPSQITSAAAGGEGQPTEFYSVFISFTVKWEIRRLPYERVRPQNGDAVSAIHYSQIFGKGRKLHVSANWRAKIYSLSSLFLALFFANKALFAFEKNHFLEEAKKKELS